MNHNKLKQLSLILFLSSLLMACNNDDQNGVLVPSNEVEDTPAVEACEVNDDLAPSLQGDVILTNEGTVNSSAGFSWQVATDNCEVAHYEVAIGKLAGASDVLAYINIGRVTSYHQQGIELDYTQDYYFSVRAVDTTGNVSAPLVSQAWKIFTPQSVLNMVLWLDTSTQASVEDENTNNPSNNLFTGLVKTWKDISGSTTEHNFVSGNNLASWDPLLKGIQLNGTNNYFTVADHVDTNLGLINARSINTVIQTGNEVGSRQVIFEEGGTVRGLNIYIENEKLHCGFWNNTEDGDGVQPYVEVSTSIESNKKYLVSYIFDYTNYVDAAGVDGTIECLVNGVSIGAENVTSRLHPHSGDICLGAQKNASYYLAGAHSGNLGFYFEGRLFEFMLHNSVMSSEELQNISSTLMSKWGIN